MFRKAFVPTLLLTLTLLAACATQGRRSGAVSGVTVPGIENLSILHDSTSFAGPMIGLGGATDPRAIPWLKESGFKTVINLRRSSEGGALVDSSRAAAESVDLHYYHLPVDGATVDWNLMDSLVAVVGEQTNQPVYVHCGSATRAAALWMVARVIQDGWPIELAAEEARTIAGKPDKAIQIAEAYLHADRAE
jgi:uncharacterized protein (TIGR01244 family)